MHRNALIRFFCLMVLLLMAAMPLPVMAESADDLPEPTARQLPRWRGFNLLEMFYNVGTKPITPFVEEDFRMIHEWGFNFIRLPLNYRYWIVNHDWETFDESALSHIDDAVAWGQKYRIHVMINLHRAPGYTVMKPPEERSLWSDEEALRVCALHWAMFAKRYRGIPNRYLSFNLLNEPGRRTQEEYAHVVQVLAQAIRQQDPNRLIVCDGLASGHEPVKSLVELGVAQATRGYTPGEISHHRAGWSGWKDAPTPTWPMANVDLWQQVEPWSKFSREHQVGVMVGEWGAYKHTPHDVTLRWMEDYLKCWKRVEMGWALWNFRGPFGILDSERSDVEYEDYRGHKLDRKMLELLQKH